MQYFLYISPPKIEMLYEQIESRSSLVLEPESGVEVGAFKLSLPFRFRKKSVLTKLEAVERRLRSESLIGTAHDSTPYFEGEGHALWRSLQPEPRAVLFSFPGYAHDLSVALVGSRKHVLGSGVPSDSEGVSGDQALFHIVARELGMEERVPWRRSDHAPEVTPQFAAWAARTAEFRAGTRAHDQSNRAKASIRFVAKRVLDEPPSTIIGPRHIRVVVGTPLYIELR